jgi:hypothetical protein
VPAARQLGSQTRAGLRIHRMDYYGGVCLLLQMHCFSSNLMTQFSLPDRAGIGLLAMVRTVGFRGSAHCEPLQFYVFPKIPETHRKHPAARSNGTPPWPQAPAPACRKGCPHLEEGWGQRVASENFETLHFK